MRKKRKMHKQQIRPTANVTQEISIMKTMYWIASRTATNAGYIYVPLLAVLAMLWTGEMTIVLFGGAYEPHLAANVVTAILAWFGDRSWEGIGTLFVIASIPVAFQLQQIYRSE